MDKYGMSLILAVLLTVSLIIGITQLPDMLYLIVR